MQQPKNQTPTPPPTGAQALALASGRNSPLSVVRAGELGKSPMARGRFLLPDGDSMMIENLQIPGRQVVLCAGDPIEVYFQHDGVIYQFQSTVLDMHSPVQLNDAMIVGGMRIAAPKSIDRGNRRTIYRQSFASVDPSVRAEVWAVPLGLLTQEQRDRIPRATEEFAATPPHPPPTPPAPNALDGFIIQRGGRAAAGISPAETLYTSVRDLTLGQVRPVMQTPAHWAGEVTDASEFGLGLVLHRLVYTRLKVFQPLVVRFALPEVASPMEFLIEVRRVQGVGEGNARVGGIMLVNALDAAEVRSGRNLARFTIELQRERAKRAREAG